jgi:two-component system response regulator PilR (NtrC family)
LKTPAPSSQILIVDDEKDIRTLLKILFVREGYTVDTASGGKAAIKKIEKTFYPLIITDIRMPDLSGIELLRYVRENHPESIVILITAYASNETAVEGMKLGAYDYITKPFKIDEVKLIVKNALEHQYIKEENLKLKERLSISTENLGIVGTSKPMRHLMDLIVRISRTRTPILITGESGTGKEVIAKTIHHFQNPESPFIPVNCGGIPETLLESELFGYKKGAFTGATADKMGLFEVANNGILFLDEIGELPPSLQVKLLRVLQDHTFRRLGDNKNIHVDIQIIASTNRNIEKEVVEKKFREDLFFRLNVIRIHVPPLRERKDDIPLLIEYFIKKFAKKYNSKEIKVSSFILKELEKHDFPGNVRELENMVERAVALQNSNIILPEPYPTPDAEMKVFFTCPFPDKGVILPDLLEKIEKDYLIEALARCNGRKMEAARLLGMSFRSFRYKLEKYSLES